MTKYSCENIAQYFLAKVDDETEEYICNFKLQKLVYYAQGYYLALYNEPLFPEPIEAWAHGPVIPILYHKYKSSGANGIPIPSSFNLSEYDEQTQIFLDTIYNQFAQFSAWKLRNMTHDDSPWKKVYNINPSGIITEDDLKAYFKTKIVND